jgi:hypothetical protein
MKGDVFLCWTNSKSHIPGTPKPQTRDSSNAQIKGRKDPITEDGYMSNAAVGSG